jgi:hypothetical protein
LDRGRTWWEVSINGAVHKRASRQLLFLWWYQVRTQGLHSTTWAPLLFCFNCFSDTVSSFLPRFASDLNLPIYGFSVAGILMCTTTHITSCLLWWGHTKFFPELTSNLHLPPLPIPCVWDYRHEPPGQVKTASGGHRHVLFLDNVAAERGYTLVKTHWTVSRVKLILFIQKISPSVSSFFFT